MMILPLLISLIALNLIQAKNYSELTAFDAMLREFPEEMQKFNSLNKSVQQAIRKELGKKRRKVESSPSPPLTDFDEVLRAFPEALQEYNSLNKSVQQEIRKELEKKRRKVESSPSPPLHYGASPFEIWN